MVTEIILPKLGQTMEEGAIVEWLKQEGDEIKRGDVLFTVESDKATLEVEASARGFLRKILVPAGETVTVLSAVALMTKTADEDIDAVAVAGAVGQGAAAMAGPAAKTGPAMPETELPAAWPPGSGAAGSGAAERDRIFASPRARKAARAERVDLALLTGTGPEGRIVERDVLAYLEAAPKITPVARRLAEQAGLDPRTLTGSGAGVRITKEDVERALARAQVATAPPALIPIVRPAAAAAEVPEVPMTGVRAVIARRMTESHQTTAPVTLTTEVDASDFVEARERLKERLAGELGFNVGYNDLLIKLVAKALREFPYMNSRLEGESIRQLSDVHVALAVDTDRGLLVVVIREADLKGLAATARELREVVARAREGKALPDELTGSTFTITAWWTARRRPVSCSASSSLWKSPICW